MKAIASRMHFIQAICYSLPTPPSRLGWGGGADGVGVEPSQGWEEVPVSQATELHPGLPALRSTFCLADSSQDPCRHPRHTQSDWQPRKQGAGRCGKFRAAGLPQAELGLWPSLQ